MKPRIKFTKLLGVLLLFLSLPIGIVLVEQETDFFSRAYRNVSGSKANLVINLTDSYDVSEYSWRHLAQGGEEKVGMLSAVTDQVENLQPSYIRIDHIYDFYDVVSRDDEGKLAFEWSKFDNEINDIIKTGAIPFLSLSYMPSAISSGSVTDLPARWDEWQVLVQRTIEHVSGKRGLAIENVYYEVWNEPDLFGDFKSRGSKSYLTLYKFASLGAENAEDVLPFKIGGPSTTALYKSWFDNFLSFADKNNLRVDFYSWHRYSKNIDDFENDYQKAKKWILAHPKFSEIELIISEAGFNSENDEGYDNRFSAIHTIALSASMFNKIPKIFHFEIKDGPGPEKYWGRWGTLTHENFGRSSAKPRYEAIEFMNQLEGGWFNVYGEGTWVRAIVMGFKKDTKVLLVNYDPYGEHIERIPITFINMPSEKFIYRRIDFLGETRETVVEIPSINSWQTSELMQPNSAAILEIIPK